MAEPLLQALHAFLGQGPDPRTRCRQVPSAALAELSELAYRLAFWSGYERHQRGECTELVFRADKDALWHAATRLPLPRTPEEPAEDLAWLLEPAEDIHGELQAAAGRLRVLLDDVSLERLHAQLSDALALVRREAHRRGLRQSVARLAPIPAGLSQE